MANSSPATPRSGWLDMPNTFESHLVGFSCVGCASDNPIGLRLRMQVHDTLPLFRAPFIPTHTFSGFPRLCQGGVQAVAMDCLAEWACIYLTKTIGLTTRFELSFLKGVPAAPPASAPADSVAHLRDCVAPAPQMLPLEVQFICSARPSSNPSRLVLDIRLEDSTSSCVYARGVVHMMLPSVAQMTKMFRGASTIAQIQASVAVLPRPNVIVLKAASPPLRPSSSSASAAAAAAAAASSSSVAVPAASSSSKPAAASFSTTRPFSQLIESPVFPSTPCTESEWVAVPDALGTHISDYNCFGCGSGNIGGLGLGGGFELHVRSGALRTYLYPSAALAGFPATMHGGLAIVAMDCLAAWCVMTRTAKLGLTSHIETIYLQAAPVPSMDANAANAASTHSPHAHGGSCTSSHSTHSLAQLPASVAPCRLLLQGELVSLMADGRQGDVVVNLYDASPSSSSSSAAPPRLCMSSRLRFTFATDAMVGRLMGQDYAPGVARAMRQLADFKRQVVERNAARGVFMKTIPTQPPTADAQASAKAKL